MGTLIKGIFYLAAGQVSLTGGYDFRTYEKATASIRYIYNGIYWCDICPGFHSSFHLFGCGGAGRGGYDSIEEQSGI